MHRIPSLWSEYRPHFGRLMSEPRGHVLLDGPSVRTAQPVAELVMVPLSLMRGTRHPDLIDENPDPLAVIRFNGMMFTGRLTFPPTMRLESLLGGQPEQWVIVDADGYPKPVPEGLDALVQAAFNEQSILPLGSPDGLPFYMRDDPGLQLRTTWALVQQDLMLPLPIPEEVVELLWASFAYLEQSLQQAAAPVADLSEAA